MRMSCNGCRVLRKGCSDDCSIRPCLSWIKSPESQANATVFLAKFYGRAGLMNLINAGPDHIRPAIFRSLLYEACGRIVNPIYGSVGLLWSGTWHLCQAAVEAVLKGETVGPMPTDAAVVAPPAVVKSFDIRHISKDPSADLHKVTGKSKPRFKRVAQTQVQPGKKTGRVLAAAEPLVDQYPPVVEFQRARSHESSEESLFSAETAEAGSHVSQAEPEGSGSGGAEEELELELTLGFEPIRPAVAVAAAAAAKGKVPAELDGWDDLALGGKM